MKTEEYLRYLGSVRKYSDQTLRSYAEDFSKFEAYINDQELDYRELNNTCARRFIAELSRTGLAKSSVNRTLSAMKGYYSWLLKNGEAEQNPFDGIKGLKRNRTLPDYMFENEIELLLSLTGDGFAGLRDRFILELLYSSGCRVSEASSINISDIDFSDRSVRVPGKGRQGPDRIPRRTGDGVPLRVSASEEYPD